MWNQKWPVLLLLFLFLQPISSLAQVAGANPGRSEKSPEIADTGNQITWTGKSSDPAKAVGVTNYILGGPNREDGDFQDAAGYPSWDGWTTHDLTAEDTRWQVSSFHASNLDPGTNDNHAWWCGENFTSCEGGDDLRGYGPGYEKYLDWYGEVPDPLLEVMVKVTAQLNHDLQDGSDHLYLQSVRVGGPFDEASWTGTDSGVPVDVTFTVPVGDFVLDPETGQPAVQLRWHVSSDFEGDQEDCSWPNDGAAQIDLIDVLFSQDGDPLSSVSFEDCEGTLPNEWIRPVVGDFASLRAFLPDEDPCRSNDSPQVSFIDDGEVVPGTGGSLCTTYCYGPGGYTVNASGGLAGNPALIWNEVWSPKIAWPAGGFNQAILEYDSYLHLFANGSTGVFQTYRVRSTANPYGVIGWTDWQDTGTIYYGDPTYKRRSHDITALILPDAAYIQVALGIRQLELYKDSEDATPGPFLDNVAVKAVQTAGPILTAVEADLAQDGFSSDGTNLGFVRFDMARDISDPLHFFNDPGDSIVVTIIPSLGQTVDPLPVLHWKVELNPLFVVRPTTGLTSGVAVVGEPDRYAFDLPDGAFLRPGDILHYYLEATDTGGSAVTILPPDTTGFDVFSGASPYPQAFTVRGLPSVDTPGGNHPPILIWKDGGEGIRDRWSVAMDNLGYVLGQDYDIYYTNDPGLGVGNGLGGRASSAQMADYEAILYSSGRQDQHTLSVGDFATDPSDDVGLLENWFGQGARKMFLAGDNIVSDLSLNAGAAGAAFVASRLGVTLIDPDLSPQIGGQDSPAVRAAYLNGVFAENQEWIAQGEGCPDRRTFDAVGSSGADVLAEFLTPGGSVGGYNAIAATAAWHAEGSVAILVPYAFETVLDNPDVGASLQLSKRSEILAEVLNTFGGLSPGSPIGIPDLNQSTASTRTASSVSVFTHLNGGGDPLTQAYLVGGRRTDASVTVTLLDGFGNPVPNFPREDIRMVTSSGGFNPCYPGFRADLDTDAQGKTTFSLAPKGGGHSDLAGDEVGQILVNGSPLTNWSGNVLFNSPDINGDGTVNLTDLVFHAIDQQAYDYRSDFYYDGQVDLSDMVLFARGYNQVCTSPEKTQDKDAGLAGKENGPPDFDSVDLVMKAGIDPAQTNGIGIFFEDVGGGLTTRMKTDLGQVVNGHVLLLNPTEPWISGVEYEIKLVKTNPGQFFITATDYLTPVVNGNPFGPGPLLLSYINPLGSGPFVKIMSFEVLCYNPDPHLNSMVFFIEPAGITGSTPGYIGVEEGNFIELAPTSGDYSLPVAFIDGNPDDYNYDVSFLHWGDTTNDKIQSVAASGGAVTDVVITQPSPRDTEVDLTEGKLYWTDSTDGVIRRSNLDGTDIEDIVTGLPDPTNGLALDIASRMIYWTDWSDNGVYRASMDVRTKALVYASPNPRGLALDLVDRDIYWVDGTDDKILRGPMDLSGPVDDLVATGLLYPWSIVLDVVEGRMYWMDRDAAKIQTALGDGSEVTDLASGLTAPRDLAFDARGRNLYFTEAPGGGMGKVRRLDLDDPATVADLVTGLDTPGGLSILQVACAPILYVDADATGNNDGTSWTDAYVNLQEALSAAFYCDAVSEIWVAEGTYVPTIGPDRTISFRITGDVELYGGFAGSETLREERDWTAHPTVLSGDIGTFGDPSDNSYHVVLMSGTELGAVLDGFSITDGHAEDIPGEGGGILVESDIWVSVSNSIISGNTATGDGGGISIHGGLKLSGTLLSNNTAGGSGGAISNAGQLTATDITVTGNTATVNGGGISMSIYSGSNLKNAKVLNNTATGSGGGIFVGADFGNMANILVSGNQATDGGGIAIEAYIQYHRIYNGVIWGNSASGNGGGMYVDDNVFPIYGLNNSIVWGNSASTGPQIYNLATHYPISHSLLEGGLGGIVPESARNQGGNGSDDPQFIDPDGADNIPGNEDDDFRLALGSPAVDAGGVSTGSLPETDLVGNPRVIGPRVDMGVYEMRFPSAVPDETSGELPTLIAITDVYPNPFNPRVVIGFDLDRDRFTRVAVYDLRGRLVRTLVNEPRPAGPHEVAWEGRDESGRQVATGVYLLRIDSEGWVDHRMMTLVK